MKKQVIIYKDGRTSMIQGNIVAKHKGGIPREVEETIHVDEDFNISDKEFRQEVVQAKKADRLKFIQKLKQKRDNILLKRNQDRDII